MSRDLNAGGTLQYVGFTAAVPTTANLSIACWFRLRTRADYGGFMISRTSGVQGMNQSGATGNPLGYGWEQTADEYNAASALFPAIGVWSLAALTVAPTYATLYLAQIGGPLLSWTNVKAHSAKVPAAWRIGHDSSNAAYLFKGQMAECALWVDRTLTQPEIALLAKRTDPRALGPKLAMYSKLDRIDTTELDLSRNSLALTLVGSPPGSDYARPQASARTRRALLRRTDISQAG